MKPAVLAEGVIRRTRVALLIEIRDLWMGLFWDRRDDGLYLYVCPLPILVVRVIVPKNPEGA